MARPFLHLPRGKIRRALKLSGGAMRAAARALGVDEHTLLAHVRRAGLEELVAQLRSERREARAERLRKLIVEHTGNINAVAQALGVAQSTADVAVRNLGLFPLVLALRPGRPMPSEEKKRIRDALRRNRGQIARAQAELGISKGTLRARMHRYGLFAEADALRLEANLIGPRTRIPKTWNRAARRARLMALLESCDWNVQRACRIAGVCAGTFYTRMHDLGIERPRERPQDRIRRVVDALRLERGVVARAASVLGVAERTLHQWCNDLDIDPRDYRPR